MPCICPMPDYIITHVPELQVFFSFFREIFYWIAAWGRFSLSISATRFAQVQGLPFFDRNDPGVGFRIGRHGRAPVGKEAVKVRRTAFQLGVGAVRRRLPGVDDGDGGGSAGGVEDPLSRLVEGKARYIGRFPP